MRTTISFEFSKEGGTTTGSSTSLFGLMTHRQRRTYDHRVKLQVIASGNSDLFPDLKIPHSTAMSWIRRRVGDVVAIEDESEDEEKLRVEVLRLDLHAQRIGRVFAHPGTWAKLIREKGWGRPRLRLYPPKPKIGFRAVAPNEAWHVDATIIKLLDGTKAYLRAVIDNYSRKILAWTVAEKLNPMNTCLVLNQAAACLTESETKVYMDSGVENLNKDVEKLLEGGTLERVVAQIDVTFSNSMIESWWRSLKHGWLYIISSRQRNYAAKADRFLCR